MSNPFEKAEQIINKEVERQQREPELFNRMHGTEKAPDAGARLKLLIERIERLEEEKAAIADDIKEVYGEGKSAGFDPKIMRQIVRLRKLATDQRREQEELVELYKSALGMV
jgi:uncharacterized protein (UPF0335 family)